MAQTESVPRFQQISMDYALYIIFVRLTIFSNFGERRVLTQETLIFAEIAGRGFPQQPVCPCGLSLTSHFKGLFSAPPCAKVQLVKFHSESREKSIEI